MLLEEYLLHRRMLCDALQLAASAERLQLSKIACKYNDQPLRKLKQSSRYQHP